MFPHTMVRTMKSMLPHLLTGVMLLTTLGCSPPNVALISTSADPGYDFAPHNGVTVSVRIQRDDEIKEPFELSLEEKILADDMEIGLRSAGFRVIQGDGSEQPDMVILGRAEEIVEGYDSYERIPVTDTRIGTYRTRRGYQSYYETSHSSVIVPTYRRYIFTRLILSAVEADKARLPEAKGRPIDLAAIWMATVRANGPLVMSDRVWQIKEALWFWGKTADMRLEYPEKD